MLYKFDVRTTRGTLLTLELEDISDGLVVKDVGGIGPVKSVMASSEFAKLPGEQFHSSRREKRNITMVIKLEPDYVTTSVRDLRQKIYSFFMPDSHIDLRFYDSDGTTVDISGVVETCEPSIFTDKPAVDISIINFQPDFLALTPTVIEGETVEDSTQVDVDYVGNIETGFEFVLEVDRTLSEFTIYHNSPDGSLRQLDFAGSLVSGDVLTINTVDGSKGASLLRSGVTSDVLYWISPQSTWHQFDGPGENHIRVYAEGDEIPYTITYTTRYGGL